MKGDEPYWNSQEYKQGYKYSWIIGVPTNPKLDNVHNIRFLDIKKMTKFQVKHILKTSI